MNAFPFILVALILYNLVAFGSGMAGQHDMATLLGQGFNITMPSKDVWRVTFSDLFIFFSLGLLFVEVVKATRTSKDEILNHALSMLAFVAALVEFLLLKGFATTAFFLLVTMSLFDVVAGYTISIITARRDLNMIPPEHQ